MKKKYLAILLGLTMTVSSLCVYPAGASSPGTDTAGSSTDEVPAAASSKVTEKSDGEVPDMANGAPPEKPDGEVPDMANGA
ncbi:MAG: hypothetical protein Q4C61_16490, partial [Lachnospiraceae bacterium]|nr:hypothetical protein [Lachnospiraceae bacterium]